MTDSTEKQPIPDISIDDPKPEPPSDDTPLDQTEQTGLQQSETGSEEKRQDDQEEERHEQFTDLLNTIVQSPICHS